MPSVKIDPATTYPFDVADNDPAKRGDRAGPDFVVGLHAVYPVHSSFGTVWFVDQLYHDEGSLERGETLRTVPTFALAIKGLKL